MKINKILINEKKFLLTYLDNINLYILLYNINKENIFI